MEIQSLCLFLAVDSIVHCLVIERGHQIVGYATFMKQFSTWDAAWYMYLDCLFLKKEIRGNGWGLKMMEKIKTYAKQEKCSSIQWQTPSFNASGIVFYSKIGAISKTKESFFWNITINLGQHSNANKFGWCCWLHRVDVKFVFDVS